MPFGPASLLGVERFSAESEAPLELLPGDDDIQKEASFWMSSSPGSSSSGASLSAEKRSTPSSEAGPKGMNCSLVYL